MRSKIFKVSILLAFAAALYIYLAAFSSYVFPWDKKEAVAPTLTWGGLAPLPTNDIAIEKRGSMFTRQFIIEFTAGKDEIEKWIKNSKRLQNNIPKQSGSDVIYEVYPGENESFGGTVKVSGTKVIINMSWS